MSGLFRKESSEKKSILKEKRGTFFARQTGRRKDSAQDDGGEKEGGQGAQTGNAQTGNAQADQAEEAGAAAGARQQEKDNYMIRCPK